MTIIIVNLCVAVAVTSLMTTCRMPTAVHANPDKRPLFRRSRQTQPNPKNQADLTLGDLDTLESHDHGYYPHFNSLPYTENQFIPQQSTQQDVSPEREDKPHHLKRSLRRINLYLSGRIMCHVFSPGKPSNSAAVSKRATTPLFYLPRQLNEKGEDNRARYRRFIPRIYIGAHYDLDEIWYGATRWIGKCSWGPSIPKYETVARSDSSLQHHIASRVRNASSIMFPTNSLSWSNWIIDMEGEKSVFDPADTTVRISLRQPRNDMASSSRVTDQFHLSPQKLTLEYDSAKYYKDHYRNSRRDMQYSPVVKVNIQTPLFHPRFEFHSKRTWVIKDGGDKMGKYYGGAYYGSDSPADRMLQQMKALYRDGIPRSTQTPGASPVCYFRSHNISSIRNVCARISSWLENDAWIPQKITTDLMGNLVSVNEIGFGTKPKKETRQRKPLGSINDFLPPRHNMGLRLRISRKIDWSKLGIFPWSSNSYESALQERTTTDKQTMRVRLELCGLNESEDRRVWLAIDAAPLDVIKTFKIIACQEATRSF